MNKKNTYLHIFILFTWTAICTSWCTSISLQETTCLRLGSPPRPRQNFNRHGIQKSTRIHMTDKEREKSIVSDISSKKSATYQKLLVPAVGVSLLSINVILARFGLIGDYTNSLILRDLGATTFCLFASILFVKSITMLASKDVLEPRDSRKIIHTFSAPLFILTWPLFSDIWGAKLFAASIPAVQALRLWLSAQEGVSRDDELVRTISRSGDAKEVTEGPFIYVVVLLLCTMVFFKENLVGIMAISSMAAGDGLADLVGRRLGRNNKWFFNDSKSVAGSIAFTVGSYLCVTGLTSWLVLNDALAIPSLQGLLWEKFLLISIICAFVELIPYGDDNYSVPVCAAILGFTILN